MSEKAMPNELDPRIDPFGSLVLDNANWSKFNYSGTFIYHLYLEYETMQAVD